MTILGPKLPDWIGPKVADHWAENWGHGDRAANAHTYAALKAESLQSFWAAVEAGISELDRNDSHQSLIRIQGLVTGFLGLLPPENHRQRRDRRRDIARKLSSLREMIEDEMERAQSHEASAFANWAYRRYFQTEVFDVDTLTHLQGLLERDELPACSVAISGEYLPTHIKRDTAEQTYLARQLADWFTSHVGRPCDSEIARAVEYRCGECTIEVAKARQSR